MLCRAIKYKVLWVYCRLIEIISISSRVKMASQKRNIVNILNAMPIAHLVILLAISSLILAAAFLIPSDKTRVSHPLTIPDALLTQTRSIIVKSGDNFSLVAERAELDATEVFQIMQSGENAKLLLNIFPGQTIHFHFDKFDQLTHLSYSYTLTETLVITREQDQFVSRVDIKELSTQTQYAEGVIEDSLFLAANKAGLNDNITMELADLLGWDIDFALDIRKGDRFALVFEELYLDGEKVKNGNILVAQFINQGRLITAIRYEDSKGDVGYFTPEGLSMRKTFRRNPLDIVRITSRFNLRRKHPVLHKIRAHKGVDYGAAKGTPVRATGDGKVINARRKGGWGKAVIIQHGQKYTTLYAHLSKYGRGVKEGRYVKQGQIIGYVGSTGLATGPHLHYEFRVNGVHRNPLTIALPHAKPIKKEERAHFMEHAEDTLKILHEFQDTPFESYTKEQ